MERNNHHIWHERKWYRSKLDKRFRQYPGFVVNIPVETHQELHAAVKPPLKPSPWLMHVVLEHLYREDVDVADVIPFTIDLLDYEARRSVFEGDQTRIRKVGENLVAQYGFVAPHIEIKH